MSIDPRPAGSGGPGLTILPADPTYRRRWPARSSFRHAWLIAWGRLTPSRRASSSHPGDDVTAGVRPDRVQQSSSRPRSKWSRNVRLRDTPGPRSRSPPVPVGRPVSELHQPARCTRRSGGCGSGPGVRWPGPGV